MSVILTVSVISALSLAIKDDISKLDNGVQIITKNVAQLSTNEMHNAERRLDEERQLVVDWLSPLNFTSRQLDTLGRREEQTGEWLLATSTFRDWRDGSNRMLWCPGMRKTVSTFSVSRDFSD